MVDRSMGGRRGQGSRPKTRGGRFPDRGPLPQQQARDQHILLGGMNMSNLSKSLMAGSALVLMLGATAASAQTLRMTGPFPANHRLWVHGGTHFGDLVSEATGQSVKFELFPADQLGKDVVGLLKSGLADVALVPVSYISADFPLTTVVELPGVYADACEGTAMLWELSKEGGFLQQEEYARNGIRVLFASALPAYALLNGRRDIARVEDLGGLKIRANGAAMTSTVNALGAVPIPLEGADFYNAFSRGTVDGGVLALASVESFGVGPYLTKGVEGLGFGAATVLYAMSEAGWARLPDDVKAAFEKAAMETQDHLCNALKEIEATTLKKLEAEYGLVMSALPEAEAQKVQERLSTVAEQWAANAERNGAKGQAALEALRAVSGQ